MMRDELSLMYQFIILQIVKIGFGNQPEMYLVIPLSGRQESVILCQI